MSVPNTASPLPRRANRLTSLFSHKSVAESLAAQTATENLNVNAVGVRTALGDLTNSPPNSPLKSGKVPLGVQTVQPKDLKKSKSKQSRKEMVALIEQLTTKNSSLTADVARLQAELDMAKKLAESRTAVQTDAAGALQSRISALEEELKTKDADIKRMARAQAKQFVGAVDRQPGFFH